MTSTTTINTANESAIITKINTESNDFPHEEYGSLLHLTQPGTIRKFRHKAQINRMDLIMADDMYDTRPSGVVLPKVLRKKLILCERRNHDSDDEDDDDDDDEVETSTKELLEQMDAWEKLPLLERVAKYTNNTMGNVQSQQSSINNNNISLSTTLDNNNNSTNNNSSKNSIVINKILEKAEDESENIQQFLPADYSSNDYAINPSYIFTTTSLEAKLAQAKSALLDIQKQLTRGEEMYYQETDTHGNMYKGWDTIIDVKSEHLGIPNYDIGYSNSGGVSGSGNYESFLLEYPKMAQNSSAPVRRMHNDLRWFSLSSNVTEQNIYHMGGSGRVGNDNNSDIGGKLTLERKRSSRYLTSSVSPYPSGVSSRSIISDSSDNGVTATEMVNNRSSMSNPSPIPVQSSTVSQSESKTEGGTTVKTELEEEDNDDNQEEIEPSNDTSSSSDERKKQDPPTSEEEAVEEEKEDQILSKTSDTDDNVPEDVPSSDLNKEDEEESNNTNQVSRKRKGGVVIEDDDVQDEDISPKKGRLRKRRKST